MILALPFALQGVLLFSDELFCHRKRALRKWERVGHAVDTLSFVLPMALTCFVEPSDLTFKIFVGLSVLSCLVVTKDEWEHVELCSGFEHWLHALLFMLHPVLLIWAGYLWWTRSGEDALLVGLVGSSLFLVYQVVYWNVWRRTQREVV